ncbi:RNA polymerase sigma factor RpoD, partial [Candidatus Pacearchaeota archaeon]|nr:RNA polymerase sigma factor RpoD [Candidatus Pacearchaeota archaeon]
QAITRAIANQSRLVRIPTYMNELMAKKSKVRRILTQELGREPSNNEIAKKMGISKKRLNEIHGLRVLVVSMSTLVGEDGGEFKDFLEDEKCESQREIVRKIFISGVLNHCLDEREKRIIKSRFCLDDFELKTTTELARDYEVSFERIRQIERGALKKLRKLLEKGDSCLE